MLHAESETEGCDVGERHADAEAITGESQQQGEVRSRLDAAIALTLQVLDLGNAASGTQVCGLTIPALL